MAKREKIDFEKLELLFTGERTERVVFSDEKILGVIKDPLSLQEIPLEQKLNFWTFVVDRMKDSPDFRDEVLEALNELKKDE